ncbi:MAG: NAD(P)-binding domain-containing protein [Rhodobacteraceae bacterium]|nr:NAD(P)-binding domain-containing protein [Paracoccaceae bacterium]
MDHHTTVIIGAGQAGLAMSQVLSAHSVDHVVLERGEVANSWRKDRWDSLRLLTPNWQSRLPGDAHDETDPDGFMASAEVAARLAAYTSGFGLPVQTGTDVMSATSDPAGYRVGTNRGDLTCANLVVASGACVTASVPAAKAALPSGIHSATPLTYKRPSDLPEGGVLVVGASATGLQLAREIHASGRPVTLAVGEHVRAPRRYRGRDIQWWMDASGLQDTGYREVDDLDRVRRLPSMQLVAGSDTLDLNVLQAMGVRVAGRLTMIRDGHALFSGALANHCALADLKMNRLLDAVDAFAIKAGLAGETDPPERFAPTAVPDAPLLDLDFARGEIRTVLWATGYRPDHSWLDLPVFDRKGRLLHDGGVVTGAPGLYALGLPFLRRRKSTLIDGAGADARDLAHHMLARLADRQAA